ncbi:cytochrome c oxidase assembly protein COX18, mitochondrial isoform 2-T6 [Trichechus inunguis]
MLCRLDGRWLRRLPVLQLGARGLPPAPAPTGGTERPALPAWAVASVSPVAPGGTSGWYEALAASAPVRGAEEVLLSAHAATGLPWWGSILLTTVAMRGAVTLPLAVYQHHILAKVENLQPEIKNIARHLKQEVAVRANQLGWSKRVARITYLRNMRRLVSELYVRDNCHPFKATVLVWIQLPMWIFISVALRNFSMGATHSEGFSVQEQLATGGVLWFPDLTALDSTWILPVSVGVINLLIVEPDHKPLSLLYAKHCTSMPEKKDFCFAKNWNVSFSEVCYILCPWSINVDDSNCCNSTFISCSLLVMFQLHGPLTELAAAFSWISPTLPNTIDQVRFRHSL